MKHLVLLILLAFSLNVNAQLDTSFKPKQIVLQIPDLVVGNTIIKRDAQLISMCYNTSNMTLVLMWNIRHYADSSGTYGRYLDYIIPDRIKKTTADNTVMVNSSTGAFVYKDSSGNYPENILYIGQFNFFQRLAEYQPILVNSMIIQYGQNTSWDD